MIEASSHIIINQLSLRVLGRNFTTISCDDDDDVYFIELQHVGYKIQYPYGPAKTA
jgi:hypothetical protein